jgi:FlaA1/EpsC-like NDP-sugar epimerase
MVTGAAGSIGSEVCRQIAAFRPLALVGFDQAETPLIHLERDLGRSYPGLAFDPRIGDITRAADINGVMRRYRPSVVFHAAAYKHVPMMERNAFAAVENNIFGTRQFALAASTHGVEYFVLISTDKVVRPTSVMSATKRTAELALRAFQKRTGTKFVAVRFGNVIGSGGSAVSLFKDQIAACGPVTVTHPEMQRYFMTDSEAVQLLLEALVFGKGGDILVLDMGEPVKIVDFARNLIEQSGLRVGQDIKIEFSGVRPGEKLFEVLNFQADDLTPTAHPRIRSLVEPVHVGKAEIKGYLREFRQICEIRDAPRLIALRQRLIPDNNPGFSLPQSSSRSSQNMRFDPIQHAAAQSGPSVLEPR